MINSYVVLIALSPGGSTFYQMTCLEPPIATYFTQWSLAVSPLPPSSLATLFTALSGSLQAHLDLRNV